MNDLIKKLESAECGSRELDWEIHRAVAGEEFGAYGPHPHYTTSLDAALTLVPEGCSWTLETDCAWLRWLEGEEVKEAQGGFLRRGGECTALALCIAALKAQREVNRQFERQQFDRGYP